MFRRLSMLAVVAAAGWFLPGCGPTTQTKTLSEAEIRESAARSNLTLIGLALHNYESAYGVFPVHAVGAKGAALKDSADKPLLSWRVAMLPHLEQDRLYRQFKLDEPWDSDHNKKLIDKMPKVYASSGKTETPGLTHFQMVVGPKLMPLTGRLRVTEMTDGTSNTVAVVEAAEAVEWTKPADILFSDAEPPKDFRKRFGRQAGGFTVLMWDGSVRVVRTSVSDRTLWEALTPRGGETLGADW